MAQASGHPSDLSTELSIDPADSRFGWLMLWSVSPTGECCCGAGSTHRRVRGDHATGSTRDCGSSPGKHPWWIEERDGTIRGYRHGSVDADPTREAAEAKWGRCEGARRWGATLADTVVLDLDNTAAVQAFARIEPHIPAERYLGIARTPRGWHVFLDCPGWNQRALNTFMSRWLGDWHGTDPGKITSRGLLLDVRTGKNRYVVWPDGGARRWTTGGEFKEAVQWAAMSMPRHRMVPSGDKAPWNLPMTEELAKQISVVEQDAPKLDIVRDRSGGISHRFAEQELLRWCGKLRTMPANSGRNNMLNQVAYYGGARAILAGIPDDKVRDTLMLAALDSGLERRESQMTIESGLRSGVERHSRAKVS